MKQRSKSRPRRISSGRGRGVPRKSCVKSTVPRNPSVNSSVTRKVASPRDTTRFSRLSNFFRNKALRVLRSELGGRRHDLAGGEVGAEGGRAGAEDHGHRPGTVRGRGQARDPDAFRSPRGSAFGHWGESTFTSLARQVVTRAYSTLPGRSAKGCVARLTKWRTNARSGQGSNRSGIPPIPASCEIAPRGNGYPCTTTIVRCALPSRPAPASETT